MGVNNTKSSRLRNLSTEATVYNVVDLPARLQFYYAHYCFTPFKSLEIDFLLIITMEPPFESLILKTSRLFPWQKLAGIYL